MGDHLVASLVPPRTAPGARAEREARPAIAVAPLPVVDIAVSARQGSLHYGMGRIDASGRISDKSILRALRWRHGQPLLITAIEGAVVVHPHPAGVFAVPSNLYSRHRCGDAAACTRAIGCCWPPTESTACSWCTHCPRWTP